MEISIPKLGDMIERKNVEYFTRVGGTVGLAKTFGTDLSKGMSTAQLPAQQEKWGKNSLPEQEKVTFWGLISEALEGAMIRLLIAAAIISIIFGMFVPNPHTGKRDLETGWIEGTAILVSVFAVVMVSAVNDYKKAKKFEELSAEQCKKEVEVLRDGKKKNIDILEVVVGDIVTLCYGQTLSADGVLIHGQDLKADESAGTGESDILKKDTSKDPFFLSGTNVVEGAGQMLIVAVGPNSFAGKLAMATRGAPADTPLQVKLAWLAEAIGKAGLGGAILTFTILSAKEIYKIAVHGKDLSLISFINFMLVSITLVVVAIPEGLPLAVTIALAYSMKSMLVDNCLVRILAACETMGGANAVCSDKTGTLTTNRMTVVQGWMAANNFVFTGYEVKGGVNAKEIDGKSKTPEFHSPAHVVEQVCRAVSLNSSADEQQQDGALVWVGGNKTEHGLLDFVKRVGLDYRQFRSAVPDNLKRTYPFSSAKKRMTTVVQDGESTITYVKGASEMVLADCKHVMGPTGEVKPLTEDILHEIKATILQMASQSNRTIGIAMNKESGVRVLPEEEPQPSLTLIAILGLQDPIRDAVPSAMLQCRKAGIIVRMVTGDNIDTAIAIAKKAKLLPEGEVQEGTAMEGKDFREMAAKDPARLLKLIPKLRVMARSSPTDKLVLVSCLMDEGDIVAVTGDGTNDAPALKLADVGFAMHTGTEVAQGASDIVLMDDNFASVVRATVWGRTVNDNIRKFLQFQLTVNVSGVLLTLIGSAFSDDNSEPLKPVQLLWLNLIMDTMAALALATEAPSEDCLERDPFFRAAPLISKRMWAFVFGHGLFQLCVMLILLWEAPHRLGIQAGSDKHTTIVFNIFIWMQLFNEFNARKLYGEKNIFSGFSRSPLFFGIMVVCIIFQWVAVQLLGKFMHTTALSLREWQFCLAIAALELPVGFLLSLLPIPRWRPGPDTDNKAGLDARKKEDIRKAKAGAGMLGQQGGGHTTFKMAANIIKMEKTAINALQQRQAIVPTILRKKRQSVFQQPTMAHPFAHR